MYTKQMMPSSYKKSVMMIIAFIIAFFALSIKVSADSNYINQADYPILKQDSSAYKSLMEHNEKSKNGHIYIYSVKSTGNLSMEDYRKNKFKDLNLKSNDMLITYAFNDGNRNVGITTGSQVRSYLSDSDAIGVLQDNKDNLKSNNSENVSKGLFTVLAKYETYQNQQSMMSPRDKAAYDKEMAREKALLKKVFYTILSVVGVIIVIRIINSIKKMNAKKQRKDLEDSAYKALQDYHTVTNHYLTQEDFTLSDGYYISNKVEPNFPKNIYDSLPKTKTKLEEIEFLCDFNNYDLSTYLKEEKYQDNQWLSMHKFSDMVRMETLYKNNKIPEQLLKSQKIRDKHDLLRKIYDSSQYNEDFTLSIPVKESNAKDLYSKEMLTYLYDTNEQKDLATLSKNKLRKKYGNQSQYSDASIYRKYEHNDHDYYNPNTDSLITWALYNALAEDQSDHSSSYSNSSSSSYDDSSNYSSYDSGSSYDGGSSDFGGGDMGGGSI